MRLSLIQRLRFDKRVVIVTGAGGGLGREYALDFAARGASVIVNDLLKTDTDYAANTVVNEIQKAGGVAVPNYSSVEDAETIVQTALKNFGRIDVLVNNAGFVRDHAFVNMTETEWTDIHRVHNLAVFRLTRLVWSKMREQKYGKLLFVTSSAGLFGNFGQANYSAAKMSVLGLARTLAIEGARYNIAANVIAPMAQSQLTRSLMRDEDAERLSPAAVAPFAVWLSHESCPENGATFYLGGTWCTPVRLMIGDGVTCRDEQGKLTAESVRDHWALMKSLPTNTEMETAPHAFAHLMNQLDKVPAKTTKKLTAFDDLVGVQAEASFPYTNRQAGLYALAVGASLREASNLKFLYEHHVDYALIPTCLVAEALNVCMQHVARIWRDIGANPLRVLHGENYYEVLDYAALARNVGSEFSVKLVFEDVIDKSKGVVSILRIDFYDREKKQVATNQCIFFQVGDRGRNLKSFSDKQIPLADSSNFVGAPHAVFEDRTSIDQAAMYRLTGDLNPIHIDPQASLAVKQKQPILHGLCTFGFVTRHVLARFANNDPRAFKSSKVRFTKPVIPGQTLRTEMWAGPVQNDVQRIFLQCRVVETNELCIANAYVDLHKKRV